MSQLSVLRQESKLRFCDAGAMPLPLSYSTEVADKSKRG